MPRSKAVNPDSKSKSLKDYFFEIVKIAKEHYIMCILTVGIIILLIWIFKHYKKQRSKTTIISTPKSVNISSEPANLTSESVNPSDTSVKSASKNSWCKKIWIRLVTIIAVLAGVSTITGVSIKDIIKDKAVKQQQEAERLEQELSAEKEADRKRERYLVGGKRKIGNLIWSDRSLNTMDWFSAKEYCEDLSEGGFNDWRLPNIDELRTIIQNCYKTETDGLCKVSEKNECLSFHNCWYPEKTCSCEVRLDGYYSKLSDSEVQLWSSSNHKKKSDSENAWIVDLYNAGVIMHDKLQTIYVRCVR